MNSRKENTDDADDTTNVSDGADDMTSMYLSMSDGAKSEGSDDTKPMFDVAKSDDLHDTAPMSDGAGSDAADDTKPMFDTAKSNGSDETAAMPDSVPVAEKDVVKPRGESPSNEPRNSKSLFDEDNVKHSEDLEHSDLSISESENNAGLKNHEQQSDDKATINANAQEQDFDSGKTYEKIARKAERSLGNLQLGGLYIHMWN